MSESAPGDVGWGVRTRAVISTIHIVEGGTFEQIRKIPGLDHPGLVIGSQVLRRQMQSPHDRRIVIAEEMAEVLTPRGVLRRDRLDRTTLVPS